MTEARKELWIQFPDRQTYEQEVAELYELLRRSRTARTRVVLYIRAEKAMKRLPASRSVKAGQERLRERLSAGTLDGENYVKVVEKGIENRGKRALKIRE